MGLLPYFMKLSGEQFDRAGNRIGERYSTILSDPTLEKRLKNFDPNLKLTFDQTQKKWVVLEWACDNSGWNIILTCEHSDGRPKAPGEWMMNRLWVYRQRYIQKKNMGIDAWFEKMRLDAAAHVREEEERFSIENQARMRDDVISWKKGARELDNLPISDATAGYRKI